MSACPFDPGCTVTVGYPPGYQDPAYDGTERGFGESVLPARRDALLSSLNAHMAEHGFGRMRIEWASAPGSTASPQGL